MKRREFITLLGGGAAAASTPFAAHAQQPTIPVIGFLNTGAPDLFAERLRAFHDGLGQAGYVEGKNVAIEYRWAGEQFDRLPAMAADLVSRHVSVIVAGTNVPAAAAAKAATGAIPIVFQIGNDPVAMGLVKSLRQPGGNMTGVTTLSGGLAPKKLELAHELVPSANTVAVLLNPTSPSSGAAQTKDLQAAAQTLGVRLHVVHASGERDFDEVIGNLKVSKIGALVIGADNLFTNRGKLLGALSLRHGIPAVFQYREFSAAGGLASYGTSFTDPFRQVGVYTGRILKGEKAAELPVHQTARVELIVNLKTARALGVTVPLPLLGRADEVIE